MSHSDEEQQPQIESDRNDLKENLHTCHQTIKSMELEQQEYHKEIARIEAINKDLMERNALLIETQETAQRDIDMMQHINKQTSLQLQQNGALHKHTRQQTQIANELMKENLEMTQQNELYKQQLETMAQQLMQREQELKSVKNETEQHKQENKELDDKNQILQTHVSQLKLELQYRERNRPVAATPINPIAKLTQNKSLRMDPTNLASMGMVSPATSVASSTSPVVMGGSAHYGLYHRARLEFTRLKSLSEMSHETSSDPWNDEAPMNEVISPPITDRTLSSLNEDLTRLNDALNEKDSIIEGLQKEIGEMKAIVDEKHDIIMALKRKNFKLQQKQLETPKKVERELRHEPSSCWSWFNL